MLIAVLCLNKMADILGYPEDPAHWNETVNFPHLQQNMENQWEMETPGMYGGTSGGIGFGNVAPAANSMFPRDWVVRMAEEWIDDSVRKGALLIKIETWMGGQRSFPNSVPICVKWSISSRNHKKKMARLANPCQLNPSPGCDLFVAGKGFQWRHPTDQEGSAGLGGE